MKLSLNSWLLIAIHTIHSIIDLFISTFLVAYFLNITDNNIVPASLFYMFTYAISMIGFPLIGPLIKTDKKKYIYNLSFVVNALLLLFIIHFKENVINYIWLLGLTSGLEKTFFWFPQNVMVSQLAGENQIIKFNGYKSGLAGLVKIIMPIFFGWLITIDSFINTAVFVLFLAILEFILSNFISAPKNNDNKFNLKKLVLLAIRKTKIKLSLYVEILRGFASDILDILIVLYIVYLFKTNLNLGIFTSIFAICTVLANIFFGKNCKFKQFTPLIWTCSILTFLSIIYFVFDTTKLSFIVYNLIFASAWQIIRTVIDINMYKVSQDKLVSVHYRDEYMALREFVLCFARILGYGFLIIIASFQNMDMIKYLILFLGSLLLLMGYLSVKLCHYLLNK